MLCHACEARRERAKTSSSAVTHSDERVLLAACAGSGGAGDGQALVASPANCSNAADLNARSRKERSKQERWNESIFPVSCTREFKRRKHAFMYQELLTKIPADLKEREFDCSRECDKAFAAAWLGEDVFCFGTKDNKLVRWDKRGPALVQLPAPSQPFTPRQEDCGIHTISMNPQRTLLATGGYDPHDVAIFSLPDLTPVQLFRGHKDWLFGSAWISEMHVVTGSRDKTVKVWEVDGTQRELKRPMINRTSHKDKVRDVKCEAESKIVASLGHDGCLKIWKVDHMQEVLDVQLTEKQELVCLAMGNPNYAPLVAVGSRDHVTYVDPRVGLVNDMPVDHIRKVEKSQDESNGVRSLSFMHHMVTIGGGGGRLSFYDSRMWKYLPVDPEDPDLPAGRPRKRFHKAGKGSVEQCEVYLEYFAGHEVPMAIYSHEYDATGTKLLTVGGPLAFGLRGCYAAVW
eukprot:jgi/Mesvir1/19660/Mv09939-RA.1